MNATALLLTARRMPEATNMLERIKWLRQLFGELLGLTIDADKFDSRALVQYGRSTIDHGVTLESGTLAFIIEVAAGLQLNHEQRKTLQRDVADINNAVVAAFAKMRTGETHDEADRGSAAATDRQAHGSMQSLRRR